MTVQRTARSTRTVYFVEAIGVGLIKIGITHDIERRMRVLRANSPVPLALLAAIPGTLFDERRLHDQFARERAHGEWFFASSSLRIFVEGLAW